MFGGDPFGGIFGDMHHQMRRQMNDMDRMMNSMMDPFGMFGRRSMYGGMIEDGTRNMNNSNRRQVRDDMALMDPFGGFGTGGLFGGIMRHMEDMQTNVMNDPNSHVYSHSTMITFDGNSQPKVVEQSVRKSGDVKEKRHSVRSGNNGVGDRMSIEHTIGGRTHVIEKKRDRDGRIRENQKFVNLGEEQAEDFDREFASRVRRNFGTETHSHRAIEDGRSGSRSGRNIKSTIKNSSHAETTAPIVTIADDDDDEVQTVNHRNNTNDKSRASKGPIIREICEEEAEMSIPKRRKGVFGKFFKANDE